MSIDIKQFLKEFVLQNIDPINFGQDEFCGEIVRKNYLESIDDESIFNGIDMTKYQNMMTTGVTTEKVISTILFNQEVEDYNMPELNTTITGNDTVIVNSSNNYDYWIDFTGVPITAVIFTWNLLKPDNANITLSSTFNLSLPVKTTNCIVSNFDIAGNYILTLQIKYYLENNSRFIQFDVPKMIRCVVE